MSLPVQHRNGRWALLYLCANAVKEEGQPYNFIETVLCPCSMLFYAGIATFCEFQTSEWYNYNDSYVSKMDASSIRTPAAYVLFYQRRGGDDDTDDHSPQPDPEV
jgi:hypothetical protein